VRFCERRTDDLHPIPFSDLSVAGRIERSRWEKSVFLKEPLHSRRSEHDQDSRRTILEVLETMCSAPGYKYECSFRSLEDPVIGDETKVPIQDVPHFVFTPVKVPWRALLWANYIFEERECPTGVVGVGCDGRGTTCRTRNHPTFAPWHDERFDRTGHYDLLGIASS
jgi:hypothetical protein